MEEFDAGDVVQLKLGGPKMTVLGPSARGGDYIVAAWFDDGKKRGGSFNKKDLTLTAASTSTDPLSAPRT